MAKAVTMKVLASGSLKHLLGRLVYIWATNQIELFGNKYSRKRKQTKSNNLATNIENKYLFQGIEIKVIELTGPTDCSTDYLEVRCRNNFQTKSNLDKKETTWCAIYMA